MRKDKNRDNTILPLQPPKPEAPGGLDAAGKSLSEALRMSFTILKIIMVVLVGYFLVSGFETVGSDEQALVLRFGKIRGVGEERILGPGLHWVFPYPIDRMVKIPVAKKTNLAVNSFWYFQHQSELLPRGPKTRIRVPETLNPVRDGYCLTRSAEQSRNTAGSAGSDYNIAHSKWQLTYQIGDPERFFRNVYTDDITPGQSYADVITKSITPLLEYLVEGSVVNAMVNYTIDQVIQNPGRISEHVEKLLQQKLDKIQSGVNVVSIQLTERTWPRQVDDAFLASIKAGQARPRAISQAKGYAENALNEAGGPVALELLNMLEDTNSTEQQRELLWSQLAGAGQEKIARARAYRTKVVETAKANAEYLQKLLPEYRKRPDLVIQEIYQDAIETVLNNADEKIIIQPAEGTKGREIRILINRDPALKPRTREGREKTGE
ncbi:MAG: SPFH domain-containing protein [Planctomycetota bacterium]|jgi:membrane protease subunit HflK